jgi:hypothetical protein
LYSCCCRYSTSCWADSNSHFPATLQREPNPFSSLHGSIAGRPPTDLSQGALLDYSPECFPLTHSSYSMAVQPSHQPLTWHAHPLPAEWAQSMSRKPACRHSRSRFCVGVCGAGITLLLRQGGPKQPGRRQPRCPPWHPSRVPCCFFPARTCRCFLQPQSCLAKSYLIPSALRHHHPLWNQTLAPLSHPME